MGNILRCEKLSKDKDNFYSTLDGLVYRSLLEISVEKELSVDNNNNHRMVKIANNKVNSLIDMVHDNVYSRKLIFNGPFGRRRCKYQTIKLNHRVVVSKLF